MHKPQEHALELSKDIPLWWQTGARTYTNNYKLPKFHKVGTYYCNGPSLGTEFARQEACPNLLQSTDSSKQVR